MQSFLMDKLCAQYGEAEAQRLADVFAVRRHTTFRVNTLKGEKDDVLREIHAAGLDPQPVSWYGEAFILPPDSERSLAALSCYAEGKIYVQSLSSMLPPFLLNAQKGMDVLDMAAAPGGKTTLIAALTGDRAMITACERSAPRAERLKANIAQQGVKRVTILNIDTRQLDDAFSFDCVLLDAPCTGSGTVQPNSRGRFDAETLSRTTALQKSLLLKAMKLCRPGGRIVYSTCSILREENEAVVESVLQRGGCQLIPVDHAFEDVPRLPTALEGSLLVRPNADYEGFFAVTLKKQ